MTSYFYFNKSGKTLKHISQYFVHIPRGHCDMYLPAMKYLFPSHCEYTRSSSWGDWTWSTPWGTGRLLGFVLCFPLYLLLSPTGAWQGFISRTKVDKGRAKHSGASTLKLEPLHTCRKISAPVNSLFPSLDSVTRAQFFWIHPSLWSHTPEKFYIHWKWPWQWVLFCNPNNRDNERGFVQSNTCSWTAQPSVTPLKLRALVI